MTIEHKKIEYKINIVVHKYQDISISAKSDLGPLTLIYRATLKRTNFAISVLSPNF